MRLDLTAKLTNLVFVVVQAVAEVLLHVAYFSFLREEVKKVFYLKHAVFTNNGQSFLHLDLLSS